MFNIVYYTVPQDHMNVTKERKQLYGLNFEEWIETVILDSKTIYENKNWRTMWSLNFFVDQTSTFAQFLWELKEKDEKLSIKKRIYRFKKAYTTESVESEDMLITKLEELGVRYYDYTYIYTKQEVIKKIIFIEAGEVIHLFVKKELVSAIENIVSKWADKANYFQYELGRDEE